jgi:hypothetical protein
MDFYYLDVLLFLLFIKPPTSIIVSDVVKLHEKLAWFEPQGADLDSP